MIESAVVKRATVPIVELMTSASQATTALEGSEPKLVADENRSGRSRHAYTLHVIDRAADWPEDNWLQRPEELPFRGFSRQ